MKRFLSVAIAVAAAGAIGFLTGGWYLTKGLLNDYNGMASENFATALALFRDGYQAKRITIFGESDEYSNFVLDTYEFVVIPGSKTTSDRSKDSFYPEAGNVAAHANGMAVMLACKWIQDDDPRGEQLLEKLREIIPKFPLSAPSIETVTVKNLQVGSQMMKTESDQWIWRMGDLHDAETARQGATHQPATRRNSKDE